VDWKGSLDYDADVHQYGGAADVALGRQSHRQRKIEFEAISYSLEATENWFSLVRGRAVGFWLPLVNQQMTILSGLDATSFICKGSALAIRWGRDPDIYLWIVAPGRVAYPRRVASIIAASGGNSLVSLDVAETAEGAEEDPDTIPLPSTPTSKWHASLLPYVRLASDEIEVKPSALYAFKVSATALELPFEYGKADASTSICHLYALGYSLGTVEAWQRFTSWGTTVIGTDGTAWASAPIEHGDISEDGEGAETSIDCTMWDDCPIADLYPRAEGLPLRIQIYTTKWDWTTKAEAADSRELAFDGEVRIPAAKGLELSASCQAGADIYDRAVPLMRKSRTCGATFCDARCTLSKAKFVIPATLFATTNASLYYIDVTPKAALPSTDWLNLGFVGSSDFHAGVPSKYWEWRPIQGMTDLGDGTLRLQIRTPFYRLSSGDLIWLYHACSKTLAACSAQVQADGTAVDNHLNMRAEPFTEIKSPQTDTSSVSNQSKK
jgi:hypothetical protein